MKKILIIDDDASLRSDLLDVLGFEGYEVMEAKDGEEGILSARDQLPDLIICDISMPTLDGFAVISELNKDSSTADIPIIFLSGYKDESTVNKGLQLGAVDFLPKPYELHEVLAAVRKHTLT